MGSYRYRSLIEGLKRQKGSRLNPTCGLFQRDLIERVFFLRVPLFLTPTVDDTNQAFTLRTLSYRIIGNAKDLYHQPKHTLYKP